MKTVKIVNVDRDNICRAAAMAIEFTWRYSDRVGFRNGVVFSNSDMTCPLYIYQTKTLIVVRGENRGQP